MTKQKIPNIRFKNYTDAWEQRKLGEVADIIGGGTPSTSNSEYWDGEIDWYSPVEIGDKIFVDGSQKKITSLGLKKSSAKVLPVGSVLFTSRAGIGNTAILAKEGTTNQGFQSIVPHENKLNSYFIFSRTHELKRYGEVNGAGSTFVEVSGKQMSKMPILIPKIDEQVQIGSFFQSLDNLTALHQRKLEDLKSFKATMLSKMFPKHGQTVPEIRLAGFDGEWERTKLGALGSVAMNKRIFKDETSEDGEIPFYKIGTFGGVADSFISRARFEEYKQKYPYPEIGDILISASGSIGRTVEYMGEEAYYQDSNIVWLKHDNRLVNSFLKQFYSIVKWNGIEGTTIKRLYNKNILETEIPLPSPEEQQAIGELFSNLDDLISSTQSKIEELETLKKKLLQEMFV